jgi:predicted Rossmann fold flavoprotein
MNIAIIGGGAAGFFMAISVKERMPEASVTIFEKARRVLAKVEISGGGRCNLTNTFEGIRDLKYVYPRGNTLMKRLLKQFSQIDSYNWFERNGVPLVIQDDHCVFPKSQDSHSIINCFLRLSRQLGIEVKTGYELHNIEKVEAGGYRLVFQEGCSDQRIFDKVGITAGGQPRINTLEYLKNLGHKIEVPVPSLFTFTILDAELREMMGAVVENACTAIAGTNFRAMGPLLITHWGMSGPSILKLSSYAARYLKENGYKCTLLVNWCGDLDNQEISDRLELTADANPQKRLSTICPFGLTTRLWEYLLIKSGLSLEKKWSELGRKGMNRLTSILTNDTYAVEGRGHYRDEFVTCGGVSLESINYNTMESKCCPGLYFAGEVLDIDGITGGFNFQAAWTTAFVAAESMSSPTMPK